MNKEKPGRKSMDLSRIFIGFTQSQEAWIREQAHKKKRSVASVVRSCVEMAQEYDNVVVKHPQEATNAD